MEIHPGDFGAVSRLPGANHPLRSKGPKGGPISVRRHGSDVDDDAGDVRWNSGHQVLRAGEAPARFFCPQQPTAIRQPDAGRQSNGSDRADRGAARSVRRGPGVALYLVRELERGPLHRFERRHLSPLRSNQDAQPHAHRHAAIDSGHHGDFRDSRFGA